MEQHLLFFLFIGPSHSRAVGSPSVSFGSDMSLLHPKQLPKHTSRFQMGRVRPRGGSDLPERACARTQDAQLSV